MGKVADRKRRERELLEKSRPKRERSLFELSGGEENVCFLQKVEIDRSAIIKGNVGVELIEFLNENILGYYHLDYAHSTLYFDNKEDYAIILGYCTAYQIV